MKVLVFGNLGAGKTTFALALKNQHIDFEYLAIDEFRQNFSDGTMLGEGMAKNNFIDSIDEHSNQIIEATGLGETAQLLFSKINGIECKVLVVILLTPLDICLKRLNERKWKTPFPGTVKDALELTAKTNRLIQQGEIQKRWRTNNRVRFLEFSTIDGIIINKTIQIINQISQ